MAFLPFWPTVGIGGTTPPDAGTGIGSEANPDAVRVAAAPSAEPSDEGYTDQQVEDDAYGPEIACRVKDLRATRAATGLTPVGLEDYVITSNVPLGITQTMQAIRWTRNVFGPLDVPLVLRSVGREIPPNDSPVSGEQLWTVYATGRD